MQAQTGSRTREHHACHGTCQEVQPPKCSRAGVHTIATHQGKGGTIYRSRNIGGDIPALHPSSNRRACMEVMALLPAREGKSLPTMARGRVEEVINISQRDCYDFIPSSFLFQFSLLHSNLQSSPWHIPPATQLSTADPEASQWRSSSQRLSRQFPQSPPLSAVHDLVPVSPPSHPASGHTTEEALLEFSAQTGTTANSSEVSSTRLAPRGHINSSRRKQGAAKHRFSSCSISRSKWSHPLRHN